MYASFQNDKKDVPCREGRCVSGWMGERVSGFLVFPACPRSLRPFRSFPFCRCLVSLSRLYSPHSFVSTLATGGSVSHHPPGATVPHLLRRTHPENHLRQETTPTWFASIVALLETEDPDSNRRTHSKRFCPWLAPTGAPAQFCSTQPQ